MAAEQAGRASSCDLRVMAQRTRWWEVTKEEAIRDRGREHVQSDLRLGRKA